MRIPKSSPFALLLALLAGYVVWFVIPCQPERIVPVPVGTKLLEFSPTGQYVVTFHSEKRELTVRNHEGQPIYATEIPCEMLIDSVNHVRTFYAFSADDRWLSVATGQPDHPQLVIVELNSNNALIPVADLPVNPDLYRPRPAFSSDCRFLNYFIQDDQSAWAVVYDMSARQEHMRIPGVSDCLGGLGRHGKWLLEKGVEIEYWDIGQKRRVAVITKDLLVALPPKYKLFMASLAGDEQGIIALCGAESPCLNQGFFLFRFDLSGREIKSEWQYDLPATASLFWKTGVSDPFQCLLIKTLDEQENLVQDILDLKSGEIVARYPEPIEHIEDTPPHDAGFAQPLGRTGEIVIDSQRKVLVSKNETWPIPWWEHFGVPPGWLGLKIPPPALDLQFHSALTGRLLERVSIHNPYNQFPPVLAMHPTKPLLAVIDDKESESHLQLWRAPPQKPWGWIFVCALSAATCVLLLKIGFSKRRPFPAKWRCQITKM